MARGGDWVTVTPLVSKWVMRWSVVWPSEDGFAEQGEVAAGVFGEVAVDGPVVVDDEVVGGFALGAVDGVFEPAVEGGRWQGGDGVGSGTDCGDDHRDRV